MAELNLAIVYYSSTGTNHQMAQWAEEAGKSVHTNARLVIGRVTPARRAREQHSA